MPVKRHRMAELIVKHLNEEISPKEQAELDEMINSSPEKKKLFEKLTNIDHIAQVIKEMTQTDTELHWQMIQEKAAAYEPVHSLQPLQQQTSVPIRKIVFIAAALLLVGSVVYYFLLRQRKTDAITDVTNYVLLPNGRQVSLDSLPNGMNLVAGTTLLKKDSLLTIYHAGHGSLPDTGIIRWHTAHKKYIIALPDSSRVKLNEGSSLQYPNSPNHLVKTVTISGAGDFDVNDQVSGPFKAIMVANALERNPAPLATAIAYGTRFHIRAYEKEKRQTISLLEGKLTVIKGRDSLQLKPYEQAVLSDTGKPHVQAMLPAATVHPLPGGSFVFRNASIQTIMEALQHEYGFKLRYTDKVPTKKITLTSSRSKPLAKIITLLKSRYQFPITEKADSLIVGH